MGFWLEVLDAVVRMAGTDVEITEDTTSEFTVTLTDQSAEGVKSRRFTADKAKGELSERQYNSEGAFVRSACFRVHRQPLLLESWIEMPGTRHSGEQEAQTLQLFIDEMIQRLSA